MNTRRDSFTYLDANASEPLRPEALAAMVSAAEVVGNPSSVHRAGRAARAVLETAREDLATLFGVSAENCVLTSGGTEANVLAITGQAQGRRVLVGATEHDAVRGAARADVVPVRPDGVLDRAALERMLAADGAAPALVCVMLANNETGVINPVRDIAALCHAHGALVHVDAVQAAGRIPFAIGELGADSIAISGHKFGGPKGAGALLLAGTGFMPSPRCWPVVDRNRVGVVAPPRYPPLPGWPRRPKWRQGTWRNRPKGSAHGATGSRRRH
ncbi:Cysteine desulfurase [Komagataeibacter europaeus]|nr:Cysteine desulfurase [Komagataeibacter europaeus]